MIAISVIAIFTYCAILAAEENMAMEQNLSTTHAVLEKIYAKTMNVGKQFAFAKRSLNFVEIARLGKGPGDMKDFLKALIGTTDTNSDDIRMELSVRESIEHIAAHFSKKANAVLQINGDPDFNILGCRDVF